MGFHFCCNDSSQGLYDLHPIISSFFPHLWRRTIKTDRDKIPERVEINTTVSVCPLGVTHKLFHIIHTNIIQSESFVPSKITTIEALFGIGSVFHLAMLSWIKHLFFLLPHTLYNYFSAFFCTTISLLLFFRFFAGLAIKLLSSSILQRTLVWENKTNS